MADAEEMLDVEHHPSAHCQVLAKSADQVGPKSCRRGRKIMMASDPPACRLGHCDPARWVGEEVADGRSHCLRFTARNHQAALAVGDDAGDAAGASGDDRQSSGLSLEQCHAVGLADGRPDVEVGGGIDAGEPRTLTQAEVYDPAAERRQCGADGVASRPVADHAEAPRPIVQDVQGCGRGIGRRRACRPGASSRRRATRASLVDEGVATGGGRRERGGDWKR